MANRRAAVFLGNERRIGHDPRNLPIIGSDEKLYKHKD